jgi:hypothetical protein
MIEIFITIQITEYMYIADTDGEHSIMGLHRNQCINLYQYTMY